MTQSASPPPVIHIACTSNERYVPFCAAMLDSALRSCKPAVLEVHFLHPPDLPTQSLQRLRGLVEGQGGRFNPAQVDLEAVKALPGTWYLPQIVWFRVLLPQLRPSLQRVLYLDSDTLVLDSLLPLWETDLTGLYAAAVRNLTAQELVPRHHALGIPPDQPYFNSGVLLMNLELMRQDHCVERLFEHATRYADQLIFADQDSLNYVLGSKCRLLHPRWNCQNSFFYWPEALEVFGEAQLKEATAAPAILHFEGPADTKPWHYLNDHPYRERYWQHLRATPFPVPPLWGRTFKNRLRKYLPGPLYEGLRRLLRRVRRLVRRR